jgi:hypothetical protein
MTTLASPGQMVGTLAAEAAGRVATLSGDVVVREAVEAETDKLQQDGVVASGCHFPQVVTVMMTHDSLETIDVDDGPSMGLSGRVRHRRPTPRAEALVHWDSPRRL